MSQSIHDSPGAAARAAAEQLARLIGDAIAEHGDARIVLSGGPAHTALLDALVAIHGVRWLMVTGYQFSEFVGLPDNHPAAARRTLERFVRRIPGCLPGFHFLRPGLDPLAERDRLSDFISREPIDAAVVDLQPDGSIGFNQPPAEFETRAGYALVPLAEPTRRRLALAGLFESPDRTPRRAITMTLPQLLKARTILALATGDCAAPVAAAISGPVDAAVPCSILSRHPRCELFLDREAARGLNVPTAS
ncbi:MAG TPA: 6-phosphogluconolactonase [Candidatus Sumerlaeota bacterium]|nr:6-phosphogluconolactonase [Candidatus Sumerlaeota bacterium]